MIEGAFGCGREGFVHVEMGKSINEDVVIHLKRLIAKCLGDVFRHRGNRGRGDRGHAEVGQNRPGILMNDANSSYVPTGIHLKPDFEAAKADKTAVFEPEFMPPPLHGPAHCRFVGPDRRGVGIDGAFADVTE